MYDGEPKYFTKEELRETVSQNMANRKNRERRPPFNFKSGAVYDGEWLGMHLPARSRQAGRNLIYLPPPPPQATSETDRGLNAGLTERDMKVRG